MKQFLNNVKWFAQCSLRIEYKNKIVYLDPFQIDAEYHDADIILITHPHFDHLSAEDIDKVVKDGSIFVYPRTIAAEMEIYSGYKTFIVIAGDELDFDPLKIQIVPAYNTVKTQCHARENGWIGCVLKYGDVTIYDTSDTEYIPEMETIDADIIFLPLGQTYTFESVEEAVRAVHAVKAKLAIPVHYGLYEGTIEDAKTFQKLLEGSVEVCLL